MTEDLRRRVVRAMGTSSISNLMGKLVSLMSTLVLVRLLTPEDFGLMAMASTVTGFVGFFNEIGIGAAIVQRTDVSDEEINGCFGIALLASGALCLGVVLASWPASAFFGMDRLQPLLAVLGFGFFFGALNTVPLALLRKDLRFQAVLWLGATAAIVQALVAIPLAWFGLKYWAIVGGFFVGQTVVTSWYWYISSWRPHWPMRLREGKALLAYGIDITFTRVLWHLYMNVDKLIIGKLLGERAVGIYDVSRSLATLPTSQISGLVSSIASPVFARLQDDLPRLSQVQMRLTRGVAYIAFPLLAGMAVLANELVLVLLGGKWHEAVIPLQALCFSEAIATVTNIQAQLLISTGRVKRLVHFNTACAIVMPLAMVAGAITGQLVGVALAWALVFPLLAVWLQHEALVASGLRYIDFWRAIQPPTLGTALMVAAVYALHAAMLPFALPPLLLLASGIAIGVLSYAVYIIYIDRKGLAEIRQVLADFGLSAKALDRWPFNRVPAPQESP